ncbi:FtsK/SpoIIIE domain-containing protein [Plantibacter sp. Mn2098]|uniref:FtsK/SpoIIIE domain-containing protein n=1 Tax=Plantibacter sp. Mn2098 TaxID=3395266 RepID=UPI003BD6B15F
MRLSLTAPNPAANTGDESHEVVLDVEETATIAELATALRVPPGLIVPGIDHETELGDAGIVSGIVLPRAAAVRLAPGTARLEFVGGPFSGEVVPLTPGATITVGQDPSMLLRLLDPAVEAHHATIVVSRPGPSTASPSAGPSHRTGPSTIAMTISPAGDIAPVLLNGVRVTDPVEVKPDEYVQLGASLVRIGVTPTPDADVQRDGLGIAFNRSSRIRPPQATPVVKLPGDKPTASERAPMPWLSALIPVVMGVTLAIMFHRPYMLMMAAASPLMVIGSYLTSRQLAKRTGKRTVDTWRNEVTNARSTIDGLIENQRNRAWRTSLDPVSVADLALAPLGRLWERRVGDDDALRVRVGVGEVDLDVRFEGARPRHAGEEIRLGVSPTPVSVDLATGVVGIAGVRVAALSVARSMVMSLAATRSPRDLDLVLLCEEHTAPDWSWWRWLPHADGAASALSLVGNTPDARLARLRELTSLLEARQAARGTSSRMAFDQHTVVLLDGARSLRTLPGMVALLEHGPAHGIFLVAIEDDRARLPQECATEVLIDASDVSMGVIESSVDPCARVLLDGTTVAAATEIARALAPIVHVGGAGDDTALPRSVRFVELAGLDLDDPAPLVSRWLFRPRETRAVVGAGPDGEFAIDLAMDGPHGLVAGTTGAGKSEFLQTLVVSLALANRPDALTFVLVDYKGGSAFADCERLPHTIGLVTNLDGRETERALESLDAELKRRERVLKDLGAKDADTAWEKAPEQAAARGLARLVLVIDEFAELKAELPEFITGLVRIARVGRSLGVHLILATQRPSGSITPEMQSNTNLRVALRVTDKGDSTDILGSPEAAAISTTTPGRGFVRRGPGAQPSAFQTARVAGRRPGVQHAHRTLPRTISRPWRDIGAPVMFPKAAASGAPVDHDDTDLRAIVNVITDASTQLGVVKNPSPWLPPLPTLVTLDDLAAPSAPEAIVLGLEDVPGEQAQRPLEWNVVTQSHLLIAGGARSGATTMLRTIATQLVERFSPDDLHMYAIDYGTSALLPLADVPHCGAVITASEGTRLQRFITLIHEEITRRQRILAEGRFGSIQEQRAATAADRMAYAVIFVDG